MVRELERRKQGIIATVEVTPTRFEQMQSAGLQEVVDRSKLVYGVRQVTEDIAVEDDVPPSVYLRQGGPAWYAQNVAYEARLLRVQLDGTNCPSTSSGCVQD
jgi:hypothetical protein